MNPGAGERSPAPGSFPGAAQLALCHHCCVWSAENFLTYPRCVAGERACPPEDCGGAHGFEEFLAVMRDPGHPEHASMVEWSGGRYDPVAFDPAHVTFDDPKARWKVAFGEE